MDKCEFYNGMLLQFVSTPQLKYKCFYFNYYLSKNNTIMIVYIYLYFNSY